MQNIAGYATRDDVVVVRRGDQVDEISENAGSAELNFMEGRMDMESNDYPGAGAYNRNEHKFP